MSTNTRPTVVRATDAEVLEYSGVTLLADTTDTAGALTSHRSVFKRGKPGAPPHTHNYPRPAISCVWRRDGRPAGV